MVIPPPLLADVLGVQHGEVEKPVLGSILEEVNQEPAQPEGPDYNKIFQHGEAANALASGGLGGLLAEINANKFK